MTVPIRPTAAVARPLVCRDGDPVPQRGAVAAIGNFDGVHLGHRRLIEVVRTEARTAGSPSAIVTFEPHPRDVFRPGEPSFRLTPEPVKAKVLGALGIDILFARRFDAALARTDAAGFVDLLAGQLGLAGVIVGPDFHFGRGREGTPAVLVRLAERAGLRARIADVVAQDGTPVSSSRIRTALEAGEVDEAARLLGYRWFVSGTVRHGDKRGRVLGYPTANLALAPGTRLRHGIYAVRVAIAPGAIVEGVASYGRRPTFDDGAPLLEAHLFDFAGDLYGREVEVEFVGWIRGEERFGSADDLIRAMDRDSATARALLARALPEPSLLG